MISEGLIGNPRASVASVAVLLALVLFGSAKSGSSPASEQEAPEPGASVPLPIAQVGGRPGRVSARPPSSDRASSPRRPSREPPEAAGANPRRRPGLELFSKLLRRTTLRPRSSSTDLHASDAAFGGLGSAPMAVCDGRPSLRRPIPPTSRHRRQAAPPVAAGRCSALLLHPDNGGNGRGAEPLGAGLSADNAAEPGQAMVASRTSARKSGEAAGSSRSQSRDAAVPPGIALYRDEVRSSLHLRVHQLEEGGNVRVG